MRGFGKAFLLLQKFCRNKVASGPDIRITAKAVACVADAPDESAKIVSESDCASSPFAFVNVGSNDAEEYRRGLSRCEIGYIGNTSPEGILVVEDSCRTSRRPTLLGDGL